MRRRSLALLCVVVAVLTLAGVAYASIPDAKGVIHGCRNNAGGALIVIDSDAGQTCPTGYTALNWSQTGPAGPAGAGTATPGLVQLDSFTGTNDDAKLDAAIAAVQATSAGSYYPAIQFPRRTVSLTRGNRVPFSGLKLIGPGASTGPKNLELSGGVFANGKVSLDLGANPWFAGSGIYYDVYVSDLAFQLGSGSRFWDQNIGTLYAAEFHALTMYGGAGVFGNSYNKALFTQVLLTGHWTVLGFTDTPFHIGGSDNSLWENGYLNIEGPAGGAGRYQVIADSLQKTDYGNMYVTSHNGWRGLWVRGASNRLNFFGGEFEGRNASDPCLGSLIKVDGGSVAFYGPWLGYAMSAPTSGENGVIQVNGGDVMLVRPVYGNGSTAATVPMVSVDGGRVYVQAAYGIGGRPVVHDGAGTPIVDSSVVTN